MKAFFRDLIRIPERERKGIIMLSLLILFSFVLISFRAHYFSKPEPVDPDQLLQLRSWTDSMTTDSISTDEKINPRLPSRVWKRPKASSSSRITVFPVDLNTADFGDLINAGFPREQAASLLAWRKSGKQFKFRSDVMALRGMNDSLFLLVEPRIILQKELEQTKKMMVSEKTDINTADSLSFIKVRGIGPVLARRIIAFRERLGGFHSLEQLREVYGITEERFIQIRPHLILVEGPDLIDLNTCSLDRLLHFPYLKPVVARGIINYREKHGPYRKVEDLMETDLVDADLYAKIAPYFTIR